jgi:hypothetical protein
MAKRTFEANTDETEAFIEAMEDAIVTDRQPWRHGHHETRVVPFEGKHYRLNVSVHHEEGDQDRAPYRVTEVRAVEKAVVVTEWVPVDAAESAS